MIDSQQTVRAAEARLFRFAPSPNGMLHLGHAYSALLNAKLACSVGGTTLLRMEDIDLGRCSPAFEYAIVDDLGWLGLRWPVPVLRQSERFTCYRAALDQLERSGLLYPCFCTRGAIATAIGGRGDWPRDPDGSPLYPGTCRHLDPEERRTLSREGVAAGLRLDMTQALACRPWSLEWTEYREGETARQVPADPALWGDALLARKDVPTSYHLSVVVDDAAQGITDVVRGEDLLQATSLHRLLQALLGLREPAYHHHALILGPDGTKLSKSRQAPTLLALRQAGTLADDVRQQLGFKGA